MTTTGNTRTFKQVFGEMAAHGMKVPCAPVDINVPSAREELREAMGFVLGCYGKELVWLDAYEQVAAWMEDNKGKGLFMYGNCGLGKSLLGRFVIPAILFKCCRKVVSVYDVNEMRSDPDGVLSKHIMSLDDIGTEEMSVKYGERREIFPEIMDNVEKYGKLAIISTNLGKDELVRRYGDRVFDRILATTARVKFEGRSLR